jgi:hypothetical protein
MKRVYSALDLPTAHFVLSLLEEEDIPARVFGEDISALRGAVPFSAATQPGIWVLDDENYERAREIVTSFENSASSEASPGIPWTCPDCGETSDAQFTQCWKCGKNRL